MESKDMFEIWEEIKNRGLSKRTTYITIKEYNSITTTDNNGESISIREYGESISLREYNKRMKEIRTSLDKVRDMINLKEMTAITSALGLIGKVNNET